MLRAWMVAAVLAIPIALGWLYAVGIIFGMTGGETWKIGYYGKFNRVRQVIERMPDVRIVDSWQHHDITLEDFAFTVISDGDHTAKVLFRENSPQMKMTKRENIEAYVRGSLRNQH